MADKTGIEWTDASWNPVVGCSVVSAGCTNCYAMKMAGRLESMVQAHIAKNGGDPGPFYHYEGTIKDTRGGAVWTGKVALAPERVLTQPLRWKRPRRIFVNSMGDLFHESVPDEWIDQVFAVIALCPQHTFQILTKRSARLRAYFSKDGREEAIDAAFQKLCGQLGINSERVHYGSPFLGCDSGLPLPNVWLGVSVENQAQAEVRIFDLLNTPAALRFLSCEPLLGPVNLTRICLEFKANHFFNCLDGRINKSSGDGVYENSPVFNAAIQWIIAGGESGRDARPVHADWVRALRDHCVVADVPFFFKQWGEWVDDDNLPDQSGDILTYHDHRFGQNRFKSVAFDCAGQTSHDAEMLSGAHRVRIWKTGKKNAGRLLDGIEWNQFPKGGV